MVKQKQLTLQFFTHLREHLADAVLAGCTLLTFIFSFFGLFSPGFVESRFSRRIFPAISEILGAAADSVPFAWLDVFIVAGLIIIILGIRQRRWAPALRCFSVAYLFFFWTWGLNYQRMGLETKIVINRQATSDLAIEAFARQAAETINRLYPDIAAARYDDEHIREEAASRVRVVVSRLDGVDWKAASRIKISLLADPWFRVAGIDGMFDPLAHEPIVCANLLDVERPFIIAHELGHVRGYPDEGDANFIAVLATLMSADPMMQYSGWLNLWLYLRTPELDSWLDPGPRRDVQRIFDRVRHEEIRWVSGLQATILDWFLRANDVHQGIRSYSRVVMLAAGSRQEWDRFR